MPKYYCEYCDVFLTHDSRKLSNLTPKSFDPSVRKGHNAGRNHLMCVRMYYEEIGQDKAQAIINEITMAYENSGAVIPPQYSGHFMPGYGAQRPPFQGAPYSNRPAGYPPFGNMSTGHLNRPPRPYFNGPPRPDGFNRPPPPSGGFNRPPPPHQYSSGPPSHSPVKSYSS
ncbi:hypothetical protein [Absidia glauca]|uniref:Matrin-type domain-containing protein n=1 Tax=Absidia glauca TaxID=4829 RepID=A0A163JLQ9_ABSGL|nr:hypothetical protein [Absidia glauca]